MRSSVACLKCRTSKIRCANDGFGGPCERCLKHGDECIYASGGSSGTARLNHDRPSIEGEPSKKRQKKSIPSTTSGAYLGEDPLNAPALTATVWLELFEIFQRHFATDLPFIHVPTFRGPFEQTTDSMSTNSSIAQPLPRPLPPYSRPLLLMFLALTSRHHDGLVADYSTRRQLPRPNPLKIAEYYATEARQYLKAPYIPLDSHEKLQYIQAYLMLAHHEWGVRRGEQAFFIMSHATAMVELEGMPFEDNSREDDSRAKARRAMASVGLGQKSQKAGKQLAPKKRTPTEQEIRRRTFWSCFILKCYLSGRTPWVQKLDVSDSHILLPCSDRAFTLGEKVRTLPFEATRDPAVEMGFYRGGRLFNISNSITGEDGNASTPVYLDHDTQPYVLEAGHTEGSLSCFIRALDIYGEVIKWSCAGGRRTEEKGPWDDSTMFKKYEVRLRKFEDSLPPDLRLNEQKTSAHAYLKSLSSYTLMHIARLLCHIMLHREYLAFLPFDVEKPEGPIDEPKFLPEEVPAMVPTFWEHSARTCFKSARELLDLLCACQKRGALVESPLSGMAAFQVAIVAVWCFHFPAQDPDGNMCKPKSGPSENDAPAPSILESGELTRKAMAILIPMCKRLQMAKKWVVIVLKLNKYLHDKYQEHRKIYHPNSPESTNSGVSSSTPRKDAGLSDYKKFEDMLKEMSPLMDEDYDDEDLEIDEKFVSVHPQESLLDSVKSESQDDDSGIVSKENTPEVKPVSPSFTAVNCAVTPTSEPNNSMAINQLVRPTPSVDSRSHPAPIQATYTQSYDQSPGSYYRRPQPQSYLPNPTESAQRETINLPHQPRQYDDQNTEGTSYNNNNTTARQNMTPQQWAHENSFGFEGSDFNYFLEGNPPTIYTTGNLGWLQDVQATAVPR